MVCWRISPNASGQKRRCGRAKRHWPAYSGTAPVGIGLVADRILTTVNDRNREMTGYSQDELVGKNSRILYPTDEDYENVGTVKYAMIRERGTGTVETRGCAKMVLSVTSCSALTPLDLSNIRAGVMFTSLDITERKNAENELCAAYEQLTQTGEELRGKYDELARAEETLKGKPTGSSTSFPISPAMISSTRSLSCWEPLRTQNQNPWIPPWQDILQNWNQLQWR